MIWSLDMIITHMKILITGDIEKGKKKDLKDLNF